MEEKKEPGAFVLLAPGVKIASYGSGRRTTILSPELLGGTLIVDTMF